MGKKIHLISFVVSCLIICIVSSSVFADGIADCSGERQLTKAEKETIRAVVRTIQQSLPRLPEGWDMIKVTSAESAMPAKFFEPPCPIWYRILAEYGNNGNAIDFARKADPDRLIQQMKEMQEALKKGDNKKVESLEKQLSGVRENADKATAMIDFHVNFIHSSNFGASKAKPISIEGAAYALYDDTPGGKKVGLYVGKWRMGQGNTPSPLVMKNRPADAVHVIEIVIFGDIALELAQKLDVKRLASLVVQ
jgi:hypothetical protein